MIKIGLYGTKAVESVLLERTDEYYNAVCAALMKVCSLLLITIHILNIRKP
jgi:hypothetical protein